MLTLEAQLVILRSNPNAWHHGHRFGSEAPRALAQEQSTLTDGDTPAFVWDDTLKTWVRTSQEEGEL